MPILSVRSVQKEFDGRQILSDISFELEQSEICAIIGKSGSGKTTLIRIIAGLMSPDQGEVLFQGEPMEGPDIRLVPGYEEIRIVHQDFQLKHKMTVRENIRYELLAYQADYQDERIEELMTLCRITNLSGKDVSLLSGGEKQRVAIARAMATEPDVLIMDEPFSNLDINTKATLLDELKSISESTQTAIILITHDARDAMEIADTMLVLQKGNITNSDTPRAIYRQPKYENTALLLGLFTKLDDKNAELLFTNEKEPKNTLWAEDIILGKGEHAGKVVNTIFAGGFNKVKLSFHNQYFWALDFSSKVKSGDHIHFSLRPNSGFYLEG